MAVTICEIARVTNTSHATVSRALHNNPLVNIRTKTRIQQVAKKLGYRPNFAARALKRGKTNKLALLLPELIDPFFAEFLRDVEKSCLTRGYRVMTIQSLVGASYEESLEELLEGVCDGVIVFTSFFKELEEVAEQFRARQMPFIAIGILSESSPAKVNRIEENMACGIELAIDHLVELGHREIVFLDNTPSEQEMASNRMEGVRNAFLKHGLRFEPNTVFCFGTDDNGRGVVGAKEVLELRRFVGVQYQTQDGCLGVKTLLKISPQTTAIIGTSDLLMMGVMRGLADLGLRAPQDISLIGTDNSWLCENLSVGLTSIDMHTSLLADMAVDWFFDQMAKDQWTQTQTKTMDTGLVIRQSTGKARTKQFLNLQHHRQ